MRIDPKSELAGVPILDVRAFVRKLDDSSFGYALLQAAFGPTRGAELLAVLLKEGYVEELSDQPSYPYRLTVKGGALANATAAKKVRRATAERALQEFLDRCKQVRGRPDFLYYVRRVVLFGSMVTDAPTLSDVDLAVELEPKERDRDKQRALERAQTAEQLEEGRTFSNFLQKLLYPRQRVLSFLKARSRVLQLADPNDEVLERARKKVIYEDPT